MRLDNSLFTTTNEELSREPRYVIAIDFDGALQYLTSHDDIANVPGSPIENVIAGISATSQTLNPDRANATIGSMNFNIVDLASAFTDKVRTELDTNDVGLRHRTVAFYMGYKTDQAGAGILDGSSTDDDPDFDNFVLFQTQIVQSVTTKEGVYTVNCADIQRETKKSLFELSVTYLTSTISDVATTIPCLDVSGFEGVVHGTSYTDAPSLEVIYIQIDKTKEIIRCPVSGISGNDFTGVTRGAFGTTPQAIEVDPASASDRRPKVEEYVYLELPAVKLAYAILTGIIHGTANVLPSSWHAGVDTPFVRLGDFTSIGTDLWDTTDDSEGVVLRFDGIEKQDAKRFLETEIYLLLGLFSPVYSDGSLGLKRMVPSLSDSPATFFLGDSNTKSTGPLRYDMESIQNNLRVDWAWNGDRYIRSNIIADSGSIARHKLGPEKRLQFRGLVGSRFTEQTLHQLLTSLRDMYTAPPLRLDVQAFHLLNRVEVGDAGKVVLSHLRDHTHPLGDFDRTMVVHGMTVDWLGGVKFKMFGSSERADEIPPITASSVLPDAFYPSEGASLSATPGLMSGNVTNVGTFTLTGTSDMNAAASVFYWDNDLTISVGTVLEIEGNVQLRVKGFLTINGDIDGIGRGTAANTDDGYTAGQHYYWAADELVGVPGFIGNSAPHCGLLFRYPDDGGIPNWVWSTRKAQPNTVGLHQAFPNLILVVDDAGAGSITGIPANMQGGSGSYGSPAGEKTGLSGRSYQRAPGGAGGAGGAALCVVCRGGDFGVAGQITLDGADGIEPTTSFSEPGGDYDIYGGTGGAGAPGALLWLLDGSAVQFPDLAGHFQAKTGEVPAQYALPRHGDNGQYANQSLSGDYPEGSTPAPRRNMAPFDPYWDISDYDQTSVNFRITYLPSDVVPEEDQADVISPPTGLVSTEVTTGIQLDWVDPVEDDLFTEVWMSDQNFRSTAWQIAVTEAETWLDNTVNVERGARYYWVRSRHKVTGEFSIWEPNSASGIYGRPQEARTNWALDPEFNIGNPDPNWTGTGPIEQTEFWKASMFPGNGTATGTHQPTGGEDGDVAIDLVAYGGSPTAAEVQLIGKKYTRFQTNGAVFQFVIKYRTIGSVDALDHVNCVTTLRYALTEFGGGSYEHELAAPVTLPRSASWTLAKIQQQVASAGINYIGFGFGMIDALNNTNDTLRIDSIFVYQVAGNTFGDTVQATEVQAGLVPKASSAEATRYLKGDGTWDAPTGGVDWTVTGPELLHADRFGAGANFADTFLDRAHLGDFSIEHQVISGTTSTLISYGAGQSVLLNMTANIVSMTLSNWPQTGRLGVIHIEVNQDTPARTIAWPGAVTWLAGAPDLSIDGATYRVMLSTRDAGTNVVGSWEQTNLTRSNVAEIITASWTFEAASGNTLLTLQKAAGTDQAAIALNNEAGYNRFIVGLAGVVADDFFIGRYTELGAWQDAPMYIWGATGIIDFNTFARAQASFELDGSSLFITGPSGTDYLKADHDNTDLNFTFVSTVDWVLTGLTGDLVFPSSRGFTVPNGSDSMSCRHDGTDINWTHVATTDWNVYGLTAARFYCDLHATNFGAILEANLIGSDGTTGGSSSAGSGNQYVEIDIGGSTYKVLHDGTV